jgi:membrane protein implicated in regulation of membrane protease activity
MLKSVLNLLVFAALAVAAVLGLFIAWWIAVFAVLAFAAWLAVRRFFGARLGAREGGPVVIEGEYEVQPEQPQQRRELDKS